MTSKCVRLYIAGNGSGSGKSTFAATLMYYLLTYKKVPANEIAYTKPVTQCTMVDIAQAFCQIYGIQYKAGGGEGSASPFIFYKGLSQELIMTSCSKIDDYLDKISEEVEELAVGKRFLIIDGMGDPFCGQCIGLGGATVAEKLNAVVLNVIKSSSGGVGLLLELYLKNLYAFRDRVPIIGMIHMQGQSFKRDIIGVGLKQIAKREGFHAGEILGFVPLLPIAEGFRDQMGSCQNIEICPMDQDDIKKSSIDVLLAQLIESVSIDTMENILEKSMLD